MKSFVLALLAMRCNAGPFQRCYRKEFMIRPDLNSNISGPNGNSKWQRISKEISKWPFSSVRQTLCLTHIRLSFRSRRFFSLGRFVGWTVGRSTVRSFIHSLASEQRSNLPENPNHNVQLKSQSIYHRNELVYHVRSTSTIRTEQSVTMLMLYILLVII